MVITARNTKLKPGYKQAEVGVIPGDWKVKRLEELGSWKGGATPSMANASFWANGTIYWASSGDIKTKILSKTASMITEVAVKQSNTTLLQEGAILIVTRSGILRKYLPVAKNTAPIAINQDIKALIPNSQVSADYLLQVLSERGPDILSMCMKAGTTVESVEYTWLKKYQISLPSPSEQRAIATALSDVDTLISSLDRLIAKKRDIKQATMQQLLTGRTRLPGFSGEWEVRKFGERCEFYSGGTPSTSNSSFYGGNISWINSSDLNKGRIKEVEGRITKRGLENSSAKMVKKGTLLLALYGATAGVTAITEIDAAINQAVLAIVPQKDNSEFLFQKLTLLKEWIIKTYTQGGQPNLSGQIVQSIEFSLPPEPEQTAIATVLSDMDAEIAALEQKRDKIRALKQGMMQELLTGKTRLL